mmetsp:Transcript_19419/g.58620  ORF Transcript_19419/g.58620 Transcript_19419/m.58620 type:complete len:345 (+) Transcript_19419:133-1167(+)
MPIRCAGALPFPHLANNRRVPSCARWAMDLGLVRKPSSFVSTICDDRKEELIYAGMEIGKVFEQNIGLGGVVSLLWFRRKMPDYACKFLEMVLILTADHGPAVSGAHNTIVTARAGKDLISSLCSGLLTIGPRFGGAIDGAAAMFSAAVDEGLTPQEFIDKMRDEKRLVMGIGHRIKSLENPDKRVEILKSYVMKHFPRHDVLDFAMQVEKLTTRKKSNLILNVDGTIGTAFVDLLRYSGESVSASLQLLASVHLMSASSPYSHSGAPPCPPPPGLQASSPERRPRNTSIQASSMASLSSVVRSASSATFLTKRDCSKGCIVTLGMIFATCCPLKQSSMSRILS